MIREYEFTVIAKSDITDAEATELFKKYEDTICADGGEVLKKDDWGVKKFAYPINRNYKGRYMHYDLAAHPSNLHEAQRLMRIDDNILRFLAVKLEDELLDSEARKAELAKPPKDERPRRND